MDERRDGGRAENKGRREEGGKGGEGRENEQRISNLS